MFFLLHSNLLFTVHFLVPVLTPDAVPGADGPSLLELDLFSLMVSVVMFEVSDAILKFNDIKFEFY